MYQTMKKVAILICIFVVAVIIYIGFSYQGTKEDVNRYFVLKEEELPVITVEMYGYQANYLCGYKQDMGNVTARDSLTILPEDRALNIEIIGDDLQIEGISYEIRSLDTTRLIENTTLESWQIAESMITATLPIQKLLEVEEEYLLSIILDTKSAGLIRYYTRILWSNKETNQQMIELALNFSSKTFDYEDAKELTMYLEPNDSADNSSFGQTTIHSNFNQISWGQLNMQPESEVQVTLKELDGIMASVQLNYLATRMTQEQEKEWYMVEENFTMKWGSTRIYLMDYQRKVQEIFRGEDTSYVGKRILLGIGNKDEVDVKISENGKLLAYNIDGELWMYDQDRHEAVQIYSARNFDVEGTRSYEKQYNVKPLLIDDNGNVEFVVYGYINRGIHEGQMGVLYYRYDESENALEEQFFIPIISSYEELEEDMDQLIYRNEAQQLYLFIQNGIYAIDLTSNEYMTVVSDLRENEYAISEDNKRIAWQGQINLHLLDLESGLKKEIPVIEGECIRVLGFVGNDLVYGRAKETDIWMVNGREKDIPMYQLEIINQEMEAETTYAKQGYYISNVEVGESRIHLDLISRIGTKEYSFYENDTIVCNELVENGDLNGIGWYTSTDKGRIYFIQLARDIDQNKNLKITVPQKITYEHSDILDMQLNQTISDAVYYAYGAGEYLGASGDFTKVLNLAYEKMGLVVNGNQQIIWNRVDRGTSYTIRNVVENDDKDGKMLDARGVNMTEMFYFIEKGIPVKAYKNDGTFVLLIGFDQYNVTIYEPDTKITTKMGLNDAATYFNTCGNDFVCVLPSLYK